jgi:hypothetical protein
MEVLLDVLNNANATDLTHALTGAFLLLIVPTLYFFIARARTAKRAGKDIPLRPVPALAGVRGAVGRAAESGRPLHFSLGSGGVGDASTAESMAALLLLGLLAEEAATYDAHPIVTVANPTLLMAAQDQLRRAYARHGTPDNYDPSRVRLVAPDRVGYAAGVIDTLNHEALSSNILLGAFGDEYLLMGEAAARKRLAQVAGAADPNIVSYVYATTDKPLLGEELFAAPAYVGRQPTLVGSLLTQDWLRVFVVIVIIVGAILYSVL